MIYKILIFLIFIAEIVFCVNIVFFLASADKTVLRLDSAVNKIKPDVREICELSKVISWQLKELSLNFIEEIKKEQDALAYQCISRLLTWILLLKLNKGILKKIKRLKLFKLVYKGLSTLANVV